MRIGPASELLWSLRRSVAVESLGMPIAQPLRIFHAEMQLWIDGYTTFDQSCSIDDKTQLS